MDDKTKEKRGAFGYFLRDGDVFVHLDARKKGVDVPASSKKDAHLVLQYSADMSLPVPIIDIYADDIKLTATLSFSRTPYHTSIPWDAVYAITNADGYGLVWEEFVPPDIQFKVKNKPVELHAVGGPGKTPNVDKTPEPKAKPNLRLVN